MKHGVNTPLCGVIIGHIFRKRACGTQPNKPFIPIAHMRFFAFIFGILILIGGLAWGAIELGAPQLWVTIGSMILLGIGIIAGASSTRVHRPSGDVTVVRADDAI